MSRISEGLCSTCNHLDSCTYLRRGDRQVIQCEEFEMECSSTRKGSLHAGVYYDRANRSSMDEKKMKPGEKLKGLCQTCSVAGTCAFPKPAGGVWHCEEFQ